MEMDMVGGFNNFALGIVENVGPMDKQSFRFSDVCEAWCLGSDRL